MSSRGYTVTVTNLKTGEVVELDPRCPPEWVLDQTGTNHEGELGHYLDQGYVGNWYDDNGAHLGPDVDGVSMYWDEEEPQ